MTDREIRKREITEYLNNLWGDDEIDTKQYRDLIDRIDDYLDEQQEYELGFPK